jgi:hypothetical protein
MSKNAVVAAEGSKELSAVFIDDSMFDGNTGFENVSAKDLLIPRITILQKMSPQLEKGKPEYIQGAEYGNFCDTGTGEAFPELVVVPCFFAMQYLEWAPRNTGKGLIKNHGTDASCLKNATPDEKRRMTLPNGNYIAETASFYILNLSANGRKSFIPLTSTGLKASRRWLTLLTSERLKRPDGSEFQPPLWYRSWKVTSVDEQNAEGSWKAWKFSPGDPILALDPTKSLLNEAREFNKQASEGLVQGDVSQTQEHSTTEVPF